MPINAISLVIVGTSVMKINSPYYERALKLMKNGKGNAKKAQQYLEKAAGDGDARAIYALGTWWFHGAYGFSKDISKGVSMWRMAAKAGISEACFDLAVAIESNNNLDIDIGMIKDAFILYLSAAIQGDSQAVFEVGRCYYHGIGISADKEIADVWLKRAKDLGVYDEA